MSHDLVYGFERLTRVIFYIYFLIDFFFNFILQHWADWKLKFVICFDLLFMGLSQSYDPSYKFDKLTWVVFLGLLLIAFFKKISSFNVELIEN